jgi:hypothetical protein
MPITEKQFAANRANAAKGTGPRTPEGRIRSACNARFHGFTAFNYDVVRLEDLQEIAHLKTDLTAVCRPVNSRELFALERIALSQPAETVISKSPAPRTATTRWPKVFIVWPSRQHRLTLEEFDRLKALRVEIPNEPLLEVQPEETKPLVPRQTNPFQPPSEPEPPADSIAALPSRARKQAVPPAAGS